MVKIAFSTNRCSTLFLDLVSHRIPTTKVAFEIIWGFLSPQFVAFYWEFVLNYAEIAAALTDLLQRTEHKPAFPEAAKPAITSFKDTINRKAIHTLLDTSASISLTTNQVLLRNGIELFHSFLVLVDGV